MGSTNLTPEQLAERWEVTLDTLQRWRREHVGPRFFKIERRVRYRLDDIEAYEQQSLRPNAVGPAGVAA